MTRDRLVTVLIAAGCLLAGLYLTLAGRDAEKVRDANRAAGAEQFDRALALAAQAKRRPATSQAAAIEARALASLGRNSRADAAFARATRTAPNDWRLYRDWAVVLLRRGEQLRARDAMVRALALNPRLEPPRGFTLLGR